MRLDQNKRRFRYEIMWETHAELCPLVEQVWHNGGESNSVADVQQKLSVLSDTLTGWNSSTFGNVRSEIRSLRLRLEVLRQDPTRQGPNHEEIKVQDRLVELSYREEIMWRQRSRIQWLSEGDQNTKFFHQRANGRRKKNKIINLTRRDGTLTDDVGEMESMTVGF
jgi:hypothetical protein